MWVENIVFNERQRAFEGRYALACKWRQGDKRYQLAQTGEIDPQSTYDILGWFCEDMQNANSVPIDPDGAIDLALRLISESDLAKHNFYDRMRSTIEHNRNLRRKVREEAGQMAEDEAKQAYYSTQHATRVGWVPALEKEATNNGND